MRVVEALKHAARAGRSGGIKPSELALLGSDTAHFLGLDAVRLTARSRTSTAAKGARLDAAMSWLCRAQDSNDDRGVAATYTLGSGWTASYPETTGYLIPTFLDYASASAQPDFRSRAMEMGEWLLSLQLDDGAFQAGAVDEPVRPSVFNTGQILFGLVRLYRETGADRYPAALIAAGEWLVSVPSPDGAWSRFTYNGVEHSYYSRVAWALLEAFQVSDRPRFKEAAVRHLDWVLGNQQANGWIARNGFDGATDPFTHTIVYSARACSVAGASSRRAATSTPRAQLAWRCGRSTKRAADSRTHLTATGTAPHATRA